MKLNNRKSFVFRIVVGLVVVCILLMIFVTLVIFYVVPVLDQQSIKSDLRNIPGVNIEKAKFDSDGFGEVIIDVKDKGKMVFTKVLPQYLNINSYVILEKIGSCTFDVSSNSPVLGEIHEHTIDIGVDKPFAELMGIQVKTIADAVKNYNEILGKVQQWSELKTTQFVVDRNIKYFYSAHCGN